MKIPQKRLIAFVFQLFGAIALTSPLYMTGFTRVCLILSLAVVFEISGGTVLGLISLMLALCFVSTLHLVLSLPFGMWGISQSHLMLVFSISSLASSFLIRRTAKQCKSSFESNLLALVTLSSVSLLLFRWRVSGLAHVLGVLKAEDNGRWVMAATQLSSYSDGSVRPNSSAGGGYLLDYLIGVFRYITVGGASNSDPATAYLVIVNIYYAVLLVSFVLIAAYAFFFLRTIVSKRYSYLASAGVVFLLFPTLSIVFVNYGHLSLLVAILFFWGTCFLLLLETTDTKGNTQIACVSALVSLGIMGGWWPAIPITVSILIFTLFRISKQLKYVRARWTKYLWPLALVLLLYFPLKGIRPLSNIRVFYGATGGVIPFSNLNSLLCVLAIAYIAQGWSTPMRAWLPTL